MKLKYTGPYAPETTWEENGVYHTGPVLIVNGEFETDDDLLIDALKERSFVPYEEWLAKHEEENREEAEKAAAVNKAALEFATNRMRESGARVVVDEKTDEVVSIENAPEDDEEVDTEVDRSVPIEERPVEEAVPKGDTEVVAAHGQDKDNG